MMLQFTPRILPFTFLTIFTAAAGAQSPDVFGGILAETSVVPTAGVRCDVNGDSIPDIVTNTNGAQLVSFLGDGLAHFSGGILTNGSAGAFSGMASGDLNNDGFDDIVISHAKFFIQAPLTPTAIDTVSVLFSNGNGTFAPEIILNVNSDRGIGRLATGDFDGDGDLDIAAASPGINTFIGSYLYLFTNNGAGSFTSSEINLNIPTRDIAMADFNHDGMSDIVLAPVDSVSAPNPQVIFMLATSTPGAFIRFDLPAGTRPARVGAADVNQDGQMDIVAFTAGDEAGPRGISVLRGTGAGSFSAPVFSPLGSGTALDPVFLDFNNDGYTDAATRTGLIFNTVAVLAGNSGGSFGETSRFSPGNFPAGIFAGQFSQDGFEDLAFIHINSKAISLWHGSGNGKFGATSPFQCSPVYSLHSADLNHDGAEDFITIEVLGTYSLLARLGAPSATGAPAGILSTTLQPLSQPVYFSYFAVGDINGDGFDDLATAHQYPFSLEFHINNGLGGFLPAQEISTPTLYPTDIEIADMNNDGYGDIVASQTQLPTAQYNNYPVAVFLYNSATSSFQTPISLSLTAANSIQVADLNLDGNLDVLVNVSNQVIACAGAGNGSIASTVNSPISNLYSEGNIADMNHDGVPDLFASGYGAQVYLQTSPLSFTTFGLPAGNTSTILYAAHVADLDMDQNPDLAAIDYSSSRLWLLRSDGAGHLAPLGSFATVSGPGSLDIADVNHDGALDVIVGGAGSTGSNNYLYVHYNQTPVPGITQFGTGLNGCFGPHAIGVNSPPAVGNANFAFTCTNAPSASLGLALVGSLADSLGPDALGVGVPVYISLVSAELFILDFYSYPSGFGVAPAAIPNVPALSGMTYTAQSYWYWTGNPCIPGTTGFSASNALTLVIQ